MKVLVCRRCGTRFDVGAPHCPRCAHVGADILEVPMKEEAMAHSRVADDYPENQPDYEPPAEEVTDVPADVPADVEPEPDAEPVEKAPVKKAPAKATRKP